MPFCSTNLGVQARCIYECYEFAEKKSPGCTIQDEIHTSKFQGHPQPRTGSTREKMEKEIEEQQVEKNKQRQNATKTQGSVGNVHPEYVPARTQNS